MKKIFSIRNVPWKVSPICFVLGANFDDIIFFNKTFCFFISMSIKGFVRFIHLFFGILTSLSFGLPDIVVVVDVVGNKFSVSFRLCFLRILLQEFSTAMIGFRAGFFQGGGVVLLLRLRVIKLKLIPNLIVETFSVTNVKIR